MTEVLRLTFDSRPAVKNVQAFDRSLARLGQQAKAVQRDMGGNTTTANKVSRSFARVRTTTAKVDSAMRGAGRGAEKMGQQTRRARRELEGMDKTARKSGGVLRGLGAAMAAVGATVSIAGLIRATKALAQLGLEAEEARSKFEVTFGTATVEVDAFLDSFAQLAGLDRSTAEDAVASIGNIIQGLGIARDASADLSIELARLAGDLTSFSNVPIDRTLNAIRTAITGEREALKNLGVVLRQVDVDQRALIEAQERGISATSEQAKVYATIALIAERSGNAVGNLELTQTSAANQARRLGAQFRDLASAVGEAVNPATAAVLSTINDQFDRLIALVGAATAGLVTFAGVLGTQALARMVALRGGLAAVIGVLTGPAGLAAAAVAASVAIIALTADGAEAAESMVDLRTSVEEANDLFKRGFTGEGINVLRQRAEAVRDRMDEVADRLERIDAIQESVGTGGRGAAESGGLVQQARALREEYAALEENLQGLDLRVLRFDTRDAFAANLGSFRQDIQGLGLEQLQTLLADLNTEISGLARAPQTNQNVVYIEQLRERASAAADQIERLAKDLDRMNSLRESANIEAITLDFNVRFEGLSSEQIQERIDELLRRQQLLARLPVTPELQVEAETIPRFLESYHRELELALAAESRTIATAVEADVDLMLRTQVTTTLAGGTPGTGHTVRPQSQASRQTDELIHALGNLATVLLSVAAGGDPRGAAVGGSLGGAVGGLFGVFSDSIAPGAGSFLGGLVGSVIGGIAGGGEIDENTRGFHDNTEALNAFRKGIVDATGVLGGVTGDEFAALTGILAAASNADPNLNAIQALNQALAGTGYTFQQIEAFAQRFGINLNEARLSLTLLIEAVNEAQLAFFKSAQGQLELFNLRAAFSDRDEDYEFLQQGLGQIIGDNITGELARLFSQSNFLGILDLITSGNFNFADLGGLSLNQFLDYLKQFEQLGDAAEDAANALGDTTRILNSPTGFKIALEQFNATEAINPSTGQRQSGTGGETGYVPTSAPSPATAGGAATGVPAGGSVQHNYYFEDGAIVIDSDLAPEEMFRRLAAEMERIQARGGRTAFDVPRSRR